jgi:hypothetical protein
MSTYRALLPLIINSDSVAPTHLESCRSNYDPFVVEGGVGTRNQSRFDGSAREEHRDAVVDE